MVSWKALQVSDGGEIRLNVDKKLDRSWLEHLKRAEINVGNRKAKSFLAHWVNYSRLVHSRA